MVESQKVDQLIQTPTEKKLKSGRRSKPRAHTEPWRQIYAHNQSINAS